MPMKCTPLLYSETGVYRGIQLSLFFIQSIDCGYSHVPIINVLRKTIENIQFHFLQQKKCCKLHRHVFVMSKKRFRLFTQNSG